MAKVTLDYLANHPQCLNQVIDWRYNEWGPLNPELTLSYVTESMNNHLNKTKLPLTLLVFENSTPIGMASLRDFDLKSHTKFSPWLASLYVVPKYRNQGIGKLLVSKIESEAYKLGYHELYLFTFKPTLINFYNKLAYEEIEQAKLYSNIVFIMKKMNPIISP